MDGWVIAMPDPFAPTLYLTDDKRWIFGDNRHQAHVFNDEDKSLWSLSDGEEWRPAAEVS